jgi:hypothetical protein
VAGRWSSPDYSVSSTNKTYRHDITEILLKVALNATTFKLQILNTTIVSSNFSYKIEKK